MKWTLLLAAGLMLASAAASAQPRPETGVFVRVRNGTDRPMEQVRIGEPIPSQMERLGPGEATPYQPSRRMIGAIYFEAVIDGERQVIQPIDSLGPRYAPGRYTYVVSLEPSVAPGQPSRLRARMVTDR